MKRFAEQVSVSMGLKGEITRVVLKEAQKRLDRITKQKPETPVDVKLDED